jgi:hypothetical protein
LIRAEVVETAEVHPSAFVTVNV